MEKQHDNQVLINNDFYEELADQWYEATDHPIALLRAENKTRVPWIIQEVHSHFGSKAVKVLDMGCGAGFLTNALAKQGHEVYGIDLSPSSLDVAKKHDSTGKVIYSYANAYDVPLQSGLYDVVCAMDILEHVENPQQLIKEASRLLRSGGLFFFHTFNRNFLSNLIIIKGVDWFVRNAPKNMHVYNLFIKPAELEKMCKSECLCVESMRGFRPSISQWAFWKLLLTKRVAENFRFKFTKDFSTGYCGIAFKL